MTEQEIRLEIRKIIARNADEPHKTVDEIMYLFREKETMECEGGCEEHIGEIIKVEITGNGWKEPFYFKYCDNAILKDRKNGFIVTEIDKNDTIISS